MDTAITTLDQVALRILIEEGSRALFPRHPTFSHLIYELRLDGNRIISPDGEAVVLDLPPLEESTVYAMPVSSCGRVRNCHLVAGKNTFGLGRFVRAQAAEYRSIAASLHESSTPYSDLVAFKDRLLEQLAGLFAEERERPATKIGPPVLRSYNATMLTINKAIYGLGKLAEHLGGEEKIFDAEFRVHTEPTDISVKKRRLDAYCAAIDDTFIFAEPAEQHGAFPVFALPNAIAGPAEVTISRLEPSTGELHYNVASQLDRHKVRAYLQNLIGRIQCCKDPLVLQILAREADISAEYAGDLAGKRLRELTNIRAHLEGRAQYFDLTSNCRIIPLADDSLDLAVPGENLSEEQQKVCRAEYRLNSSRYRLLVYNASSPKNPRRRLPGDVSMATLFEFHELALPSGKRKGSWVMPDVIETNMPDGTPLDRTTISAVIAYHFVRTPAYSNHTLVLNTKKPLEIPGVLCEGPIRHPQAGNIFLYRAQT